MWKIVENIYNYWLSNIKGIGAVKISELLKVFCSAKDIYRADRRKLVKSNILKEKDINALVSSRDYDKLSRGYEKLVKDGIKLLNIFDPEYPERLKNIHAAPFALYIKGKIPPPNMKALAIVGARECSGYGLEAAKYLAGTIAKEGIIIISGLARGIDSYAHIGALNSEGITYGVMGCGIDICYPRENFKIYMDMQESGGIISEYAPGIQPYPCNFPMRNRIISGLSNGILVIEARVKSGSLITVDMGLDQGKDIYALPGRISDNLSTGCNNLIKMGAKLVSSPQDILEDFLICSTDNIKNKSGACRDSCNYNNLLINNKIEKTIYDILNLVPKHIEEIAIETNYPISSIMEHLLYLEIKNLVRQTMRNYYVRTH